MSKISKLSKDQIREGLKFQSDFSNWESSNCINQSDFNRKMEAEYELIFNLRE